MGTRGGRASLWFSDPGVCVHGGLASAVPRPGERFLGEVSTEGGGGFGGGRVVDGVSDLMGRQRGRRLPRRRGTAGAAKAMEMGATGAQGHAAVAAEAEAAEAAEVAEAAGAELVDEALASSLVARLGRAGCCMGPLVVKARVSGCSGAVVGDPAVSKKPNEHGRLLFAALAMNTALSPVAPERLATDLV